MKVAIVARAPSSRFLAPYHDPTWQIWTLSPMEYPRITDVPRWDLWYELHNVVEKDAENPGYIKWLKAHGSKVILREMVEACPEAQIFPRDMIFEFFQGCFTEPFTYYNNSVSLMMAQAIYEMVHSGDEQNQLGLYGVDMCQVSEYGHQKPSCEVFIGMAAGFGIKVTIPPECDLCKCHRIYGLESETHYERKLRVHEKEMEDKVKMWSAELNMAKKRFVGATAVYNEYHELMKNVNGEMSDDFKLILEGRLKQVEYIADQQKVDSERVEEQLKMGMGALEEIKYQLTLI